MRRRELFYRVTTQLRLHQYSHFSTTITIFNNNNNSRQVLSLFKNGEAQLAVDEYFKQPHQISASYLIARHGENVTLAQKIYQAAKQHNCVNLYVVMALIGVYQKNQQKHSLWCEAIQEFNREILTDQVNESTVNTMLKGLHDAGRMGDCLLVLRYLAKCGKQPQKFIISSILNSCSKSSDIQVASEVWDLAINHFNIQPNIVEYTCMIKVLVASHNLERAVEMLKSMGRDGIEPNVVTYTVLLNACTKSLNLKLGKEVHDQLTKSGLVPDSFLKNTLLDMYGTLGDLPQGLRIFEAIPDRERTVVTWNTLIKGYVIADNLSTAVDLLNRMRGTGVKPNEVTYTIMLTHCASSIEAKVGQLLHTQLVKDGIQPTPNLLTALVNMYGKCGNVESAYSVFNGIPEQQRNVIIYSAMINAYVSAGQFTLAIELLNRMVKLGVKPNSVTYLILINACLDTQIAFALSKYLIRDNIKQDVKLKCALVSMYGRCQQLNEALAVFNTIPEKQRSTEIWNAVINACVVSGSFSSAIDILYKMSSSGVQPDSFTYLRLIADCTELHIGEILHQRLINERVYQDLNLKNTLLDMYGRFKMLDQALFIFNTIPVHDRDTVTWNNMIKAYVAVGDITSAIQALAIMKNSSVQPDSVTYIILLNGCTDSSTLPIGQQLHKYVKEANLSDNSLKNALLNMYSQCGSLKEALAVFDSVPESDRTVVTWTTLIKAYTVAKEVGKAVGLLDIMSNTRVMPNAVTYTILLTACADSCLPELGQELHRRIGKEGVEQTDFLKNSLVNMYGKGGRVKDAVNAFDTIQNRDIVAWNTLLQTYAQNGLGTDTLRCFQLMQKTVKPDAQTLVSVLTACSHAFLVKEAVDIYNSMELQWNISPKEIHHNCMVDVLARSGRLDDAEKIIMEKVQNSTVAWMTLLGACRSKNDVSRGRRAFEMIKQVNEGEDIAAAYVLMSNIYAMSGDKQNRSVIRNEMDQKKIRKRPGMTSILVNGQVHNFVSEDNRHPQIEQIRKYLDALIGQMMDAGYRPDPNWVTRDIEELSEQQRLVCLHSEKIALAYGLMETPAHSPITISNNLRVCGDCHNATKYIAKISNRTITLRDANRLHHFTPDGECSCCDKW